MTVICSVISDFWWFYELAFSMLSNFVPHPSNTLNSTTCQFWWYQVNMPSDCYKYQVYITCPKYVRLIFVIFASNDMSGLKHSNTPCSSLFLSMGYGAAFANTTAQKSLVSSCLFYLWSNFHFHNHTYETQWHEPICSRANVLVFHSFFMLIIVLLPKIIKHFISRLHSITQINKFLNYNNIYILI